VPVLRGMPVELIPGLPPVVAGEVWSCWLAGTVPVTGEEWPSTSSSSNICGAIMAQSV
jgi:hypothetical protein